MIDSSKVKEPVEQDSTVRTIHGKAVLIDDGVRTFDLHTEVIDGVTCHFVGAAAQKARKPKK